MSDAFQARVDQFVEEILELLERAHADSREAAIEALAALSRQLPLPGLTGHDLTAPASKPRAPRSRPAPKSKPAPRSRRVVAEEPAPVVEEAAPPPASERAPASDGPVAEREVRVLDAVRALSRATASEVAEHARQPNGSVVVTLRALVARGLVVRVKTDRGMEYGLSPSAAVA